MSSLTSQSPISTSSASVLKTMVTWSLLITRALCIFIQSIGTAHSQISCASEKHDLCVFTTKHLPNFDISGSYPASTALILFHRLSTVQAQHQSTETRLKHHNEQARHRQATVKKNQVARAKNPNSSRNPHSPRALQAGCSPCGTPKRCRSPDRPGGQPRAGWFPTIGNLEQENRRRSSRHHLLESGCNCQSRQQLSLPWKWRCLSYSERGGVPTGCRLSSRRVRRDGRCSCYGRFQFASLPEGHPCCGTRP